MDNNLNADQLMAAIKHRRSMGLSKLSPDPVDPHLVNQMLEAANWAPSHGDTEPWRFTVFAAEGRAALADLYGDAYRASATDFNQDKYEANRNRAYAAPVWISIGMVPARRDDGTLKMTEQDELMAIACAVQNLHLMASTLGIAGMWHSKGLSIDPTVAKGLGLNTPDRLLGFFMCGHPASGWTTGERGPLSEKVKWVTEAS